MLGRNLFSQRTSRSKNFFEEIVLKYICIAQSNFPAFSQIIINGKYIYFRAAKLREQRKQKEDDERTRDKSANRERMRKTRQMVKA